MVCFGSPSARIKRVNGPANEHLRQAAATDGGGGGCCAAAAGTGELRAAPSRHDIEMFI